MDICKVLDNITKADIEQAKELVHEFDKEGIPWRSMVEGELWSLEDSRIIQTITYLRLAKGE